MMNYELMLGDNLEVLRGMREGSVDAIVTDPPYELGFMGKAWDRTGVAYSVELWRECLRVLKPGGYVLAFGGTRTFHRMVCAIEDAGFEIRDMIEWVYGSGFPKSRNLDGEREGWGTALKPAHEPVTMARKPLDGTVAVNVRMHGTGALNIDGCRIAAADAPGGNYTCKRLRPGAGIDAPGKWHQDVMYEGEQKPGRWPANVIHDGSEEVLAVFPQEAGACAPVTGREPTANGFSGAVKFGGLKGRVDQGATFRNDRGSAARFFYCAKTSTLDRNEGCEELPDQDWREEGACVPERENRPFKPSKNHHATVKPTELMRYLCRLVTPPGGVVLDPFMGSGSTGKGALLEGMSFVGIEKEAEWLPIAEARLKHALRSKAQLELALT